MVSHQKYFVFLDQPQKMFVYSPRSDEIFSQSQTASALTIFFLLEQL